MRQIAIIIVAVFAALAFFNPSAPADQKQVSVTWTYDNPPSDLAGFHLYLNGTQVQDLNVPTARSWTGTLDLQDGDNEVGVSAYDVAGNESEQSTATFNPPPHKPGTIVITIGGSD